MDMTEYDKLHGAIDSTADRLKEAKKTFLNTRGWKETCATPGSIWLWTKRVTIRRRYRNAGSIKVDGKWIKNPNADGWTEETTTYDALCGLDLAVTIEHNLTCETQEY